MERKSIPGINVSSLYLLVIVVLLFSSCTGESNMVDGNNSKLLNFSVSVPSWSNAGDNASKAETRAAPMAETSFSTSYNFNLYADQYDGSSSYTKLIDNESVSYSNSNSMWQTDAPYYWSGTSSKTINFYAYYPTDISTNITHTTAGTAPVLTYTVPSAVADQKDVIVATASAAGNTNAAATLSFNHIFAAVKFSVGTSGLPSGTIASISISGINNSGTYTFGNGWTLGSTSSTFTVSPSTTIAGTSGASITSGTYTLMMIPQTFTDATITVTYSNGTAFSQTISGTWAAGNTYTYNLSKTVIYNYAYTGGVQTFTAPYTGTYKIECWGAEGNSLKGGYSSGTISLTKGQTIYTYVGGVYSDGAYFNWDGSTDFRLNKVLIYTPGITNLGTTTAIYYGPYWKNVSGIYQVDMSGSGFGNCAFTSYNYVSGGSHTFAITKMTKTANHLTAFINVDIDTSSLSGIEFVLSWDDTKYDVSISQAIMSNTSDVIIVGAGYNSSNSTKGVSNGTSQDHVQSGNGYARITFVSAN